MTKKMLIDTAHAEETRVVVVDGQRIEEFDFENHSRKQLRGNIYLAKVIRVEPSLQAAFVEYGGNRHGFLAFNEIHPDYYQIPVADRQALLEEDARAERESEREDERRSRGNAAGAPRRRERTRSRVYGGETVAAPAEEAPTPADAAEEAETEAAASGVPNGEADSSHDETEGGAEPRRETGDDADAPNGANVEMARATEDDEHVEQVGGDGDALAEIPERPRHHRRQYKIQEVIKRRQILLVQVVKEERGNKGAALTTYLSLAGRYSVLMPNTGKGGGISRKITSAEDRKRLKEMVRELEVPDGMGIILRTAGASRTKPEIKRDYEYLMRLWESVRELTLKSAAPALVYEEGSLVKRAIRDLYNRDIEEIVVSGDEGYREAKDFMRMLMPSHAKMVRPYRDPTPLFARSGVESQLDAMFSNVVTLKSGGYLVINPTEALVSIDVNSGRSTREHNIEDTALKTNLEAAEEISRQLRLRDLAGLIVIDFIDMEERRNNRSVEKKLNECLKNDRARIQVGRISPFGLLEMSRQRIRTGVLESSSVICPNCGGSGFVRSTPSVALQILRSIEESLLRSASHNLVVRTRVECAFYILNQKRGHLRDIETRFGVTVTVVPDESLTGSTTFAIDRGELATPAERRPSSTGVRMDSITPVDEPIEIEPTAEYEREEDEEAETGTEVPREAGDEESSGENGRPRRRRRRRRGRGPRELDGSPANGDSAGEEDEGEEDEPRPAEVVRAPSSEVEADESAPEPAPEEISRPRSSRGERAPRANGPVVESEARPERTRPPERAPEPPSAEPVEPAEAAQVAAEPEPEPVAVVLTPPDPDRPKRGGWWSKAKAALGGS